jgi:hypothetical protein
MIRCLYLMLLTQWDFSVKSLVVCDFPLLGLHGKSINLFVLVVHPGSQCLNLNEEEPISVH